MKRTIGLISLLPILVIDAFSQISPISITLYSPATNTVSTGDIYFNAEVRSQSPIANVEVFVDGQKKFYDFYRIIAPTYPSSANYGSIVSVEPLAKGVHVFTLRVTDDFFNSREAAVPFFYTDAPILTLRSPFSQTFANPSIQIDASATDSDGDVVI